MRRFFRQHRDIDGLAVLVTAACVVFFALWVLYGLGLWHWARASAM